MDRIILALLAGVLAGFSLLKVSFADTFLFSLEPIFTIIGVLAVTVFSLVLIFKAVTALFNK
ncbi:hypothetical protein D0469_10935 [Peribacillus saganii]|uniref:DUF3955 domain-containing protein n=1 Tax=Peribacillus saganii TaxID=2303992 RepID=A0A372LQB9_9BACI|nr:hypothetical protein [Peribacillus saganii]RFU68989.1 hypothetical protein D0469_10935 [Peribacillus saganii]